MNPRQDINHLRNTRANLNHIVANYPAWHRWLASLLPDGYPTGSDFNVTSRGGTSDPTSRIALGRANDAALLDEASHITQQLDDLTNRLANLLTKGPQRIDTAAIVRAARCSGAIDPTCTRLADGRRHKTGLCDACWQQQYRQTRNQE